MAPSSTTSHTCGTCTQCSTSASRAGWKVSIMSVQFGKCNFDGKPVDPGDLDPVRPVLAPYGPDGEGYICRDNFGILFRAFHTNKESRRERQPRILAHGVVLTWDGRLD